MQRLFKIFIFIFALLVISTPIIQQQFKIITDTCILYGSYTEAKDTSLTLSNWFSGTYQAKKEKCINEQFGFRDYLVKIHKQIEYSFFKEINLPDVFIGKNNYLFSSSFFNCYSGRVYKGNPYADSVFNNIQKLHHWLASKNKKLLLCITPCKESFYPEYLPDSCTPYIKKENYYNYYKQQARLNNIPLLDFNAYFLKMKTKTPYPLFTHGAVHWTSYGTYLALDSLLRRMSAELHKKINLIRLGSCTWSDSAKDNDDDIYKTMNLLTKIKNEKLAYPKIDYVYKQDSCFRPKVMIIGDSFYQSLNNTWLPLTFFSKESMFLYYFTLAIPYDPQKKDLPVSQINLEKELENTDLVLFFFSVGRLDEFSKHVKTIKAEKLH